MFTLPVLFRLLVSIQIFVAHSVRIRSWPEPPPWPWIYSVPLGAGAMAL